MARATVRCVVVTLDSHLAGAMDRVRATLRAQCPALDIRVHVAADWPTDEASAARCRADLEGAHLVVVTQLFIEEHVATIAPTLRAHRDRYDALLVAICAPELMRLTKLGSFSMDPKDADGRWSAARVLRKMFKRPSGPRTGEDQMRSLRRIPAMLRFIPGTAQDVRAYYVSLQYWLAGSAENLGAMLRMLVRRYGREGRAEASGRGAIADPVSYPETGVYHPRLPVPRMDASLTALDRVRPSGVRPRVGVLVTRSYVLAGNTAHYDAVIDALERRGLDVVPAFASGLDARPAIDRYFRTSTGAPAIDAMVSLSGFSLVGGPAYSDVDASREALATLDVPYLAVQALEFQSQREWSDDPRGLNPLQATLQVAIPELEGATGSMVFGGRGAGGMDDQALAAPIPDRVQRLADRVASLVRLRRTATRDRKLAIVLFNFPPNAANIGTAAYLAVFASLHRLLTELSSAGYTVDVPADVDALREQLLAGNASQFNMPAAVAATIRADDHVRRERYLPEIERAWGPAPGRQQSDGRSIFVLGQKFGNIFVGIQPGFGYEGDPMRLLFERGFAPTHAFSAFYGWIRHELGAHAVLHFGTHGALEFMPGKQVGLSAACWPDRLIGDLPNVYLYASNNPAEGTLAKRRGAATLVSYLTPPITNAGLYRDLAEVRSLVTQWQDMRTDDEGDRSNLTVDLQRCAAALDLVDATPAWNRDAPEQVTRLRGKLLELEQALIPNGLHVLGTPMSLEARADTLLAILRGGGPDVWGDDEVDASAAIDMDGARAAVEGLVSETHDEERLADALGAGSPGAATAARHLAKVNDLLADSREIEGLLRALDGRFIAPAPGGDLLRTAAVLPTGRNVHGFDPYRVPTPSAMRDGARQAAALLARHVSDGLPRPETVAVVLWGSDNMKSDGASLGVALALLGAAPRFDGLGRLAGARLIPLDELTHPRIDVVVTISGIFRDLFPLQVRVLAEAALLAASADEPAELNHVRAHALALQADTGVTLEEAALRVFSNAEGAYGANVNLLVDDGSWSDSAELGDAFLARKCWAYGARGASPTSRRDLFERGLQQATIAYQVLDGIENGATDLDQYVDSLGALTQVMQRGSSTTRTYLGDFSTSNGAVRTVEEQVSLETRTRLLNPRWYEPMLAAGFEGARGVSARVTTTLGWSATTGTVAPWVYRQIAETWVVDDTMRRRMEALNPHATAQICSRLLEAGERGFWQPDDATLDALHRAQDELDDALEGITLAPHGR